MTIDYVLAPEHKRRYVYPASYGAAAGTPIVGGKIYTYQAEAHTTLKPTYTSNIGSPPPLNTNPIILDDSGECVIYWAFDENLGTDISNFYYVELRDPNNVLIDSYDMYNGVPFPAGTSGQLTGLINFITNPQFSLNHFGKQSYNLKNQSGGGYNPAITNAGTCFIADDWYWTKSNTSTTETMSIQPFDINQIDVPFNPINYLRWNVSAPGSGETYKSFYKFFPGVQTFSNEPIWVQCRARSSTSTSFNIVIRQFFGTGGSPSADVVSSPLTVTTTSDWPSTVQGGLIEVPQVTGVIGTDGNDGVLIEIDLPTNAAGGTTIDFVNFDAKNSSVLTAFQYNTVNIQNTQTNRDWFGVRTGKIEQDILLATQNPGWLPLNDGSIGNAVSSATEFASENSFGLYSLLWSNTIQANCPVSNGSRGVSAVADFDAGYRITLPPLIDRFPLTLSNPTTASLAAAGGSSTIATGNLPSHFHTLSGGAVPAAGPGWNGATNGVQSGGTFDTATTNPGTTITSISQTDPTGSGTSYFQPYTLFYSFIKL